jgi:hypothetical protein
MNLPRTYPEAGVNCTPDTFRIAQLKWSSGARPGSKVDTPIFETENMRKKILSFAHFPMQNSPEWLVLFVPVT